METMRRIDRTTLSYVIALALIAALAIGTHVLVDTVVKRMEDAAEVVNVSGRQRMLSQRIASFAERLAADGLADRTQLEGRLRSAVDLMGQSHQDLVDRLDSPDGIDTPALREIYFDAPHNLDARVRLFVEQARIFLDLTSRERRTAAVLAEMERAAQEPLLASLNTAVDQYQFDSEMRVKRLRRILFVMLGVMLMALVVEAIWIFRPLIRRLTEANRTLTTALSEVGARRSQVSRLLDNSGQGFFSFGRDLKADAESSRACELFLGRPPGGNDVASLLFGSQPETAGLLRSVMSDVFADPDPFRREMMLSLLPERLDIGGFVLRLECKSVADDRVMAVLTDLTEEVALSERILQERKQSEMIVAAVVDRHDFFLATEELREFLLLARKMVERADSDLQTLDVVFRRTHTCKGVLGQFGFPAVASALHRAEDGLMAARTRLAGRDAGPIERFRVVTEALAALDLVEIESRFEEDLAVVRDALGDDYVRQGGATPVPPDMTRALANLADRLLKRESLDLGDNAVFDLLARTSRLTKVSLSEVLRGYDRLVQQLALRFEKDIEPVSVTGPDIWVDMDRYAGALRAMVHVFRNAVTHGIETPEEREDAQKPPTGNVGCVLAMDGRKIRISISDDGRGVDVDAMRAKLGEDIARGKSDQQIVDRIFEDGISTSETIDEISGRGVGLPALADAVRILSGSIRAETVRGSGTTIVIEFPISSDTVVAHASNSSED